MRLIDADKFLEDERKRCLGEPLVGTCSFDNIDLSTEIRNAETVDAEPVRHGKWEEITTHNGCTYDYDCVCSVCGYSGMPEYSYCPNCGAKME